MLGVTIVSACTGGGGPDTVATTTTVAPETTTTTEPALDAGTQVFVYTPEVGDCFDRRQLPPEAAGAGGQTEIVLLLDCALPHQNEVFALVDHPGSGEPFPGEEALEAFAQRECPASFEGFVGRAYEVSDLEIGFHFPTEANWSAGSRTIGCYVYDLDGDKLVGSMQGSGR
jgi:hypothetical protein